jgi:chain length determinant protein tyrosine kinase EpsG
MANNEVVTAQNGGISRTHSALSIGAILVDAGRLNADDIESIMRLRREQGLRFGDAAIQLGLLTKDDIEFAISRQFDYPYLLRGESAVSETLTAAYAPFSPQVESLRALRSQLMLRWFDGEVSHKSLAIVSAERKDGCSLIAANLAIVFSQLGEHTLLIDANMRHPAQHQLFGLDNSAGLSAVLTGRGGPDTIQRIPALRDLSVLPAGVSSPNPSELLARPEFAKLLNDLGREYDVILIDTPAASETTDAQIITMRAGGALLVVRKNSSRRWRVQGIAENAVQTNTTIVGTVLNDF